MLHGMMHKLECVLNVIKKKNKKQKKTKKKQKKLMLPQLYQ